MQIKVMRLAALILMVCALAIDGHAYGQKPVNQVEQHKATSNADNQSKDTEKEKFSNGSAVNHAASEQEASSGEGGPQHDANRQIQRVEITAQPADGGAVASAVITGLALLASWGAIWLLWRQNNHMRDSSERQLRAYICITGGDFRMVNRIPCAAVVFKNCGQTPAYDVRSWIHLWNEEYPLKVNLPVPDDEFRMSRNVIGPGSDSTQIVPERGAQPIPDVFSKDVGTEKWTIYVYGEIRYRDAFGKHRYTKYRLIYGGPEGGRGNILCPDVEGNEAD
jgi:hypothetical protein